MQLDGEVRSKDAALGALRQPMREVCACLCSTGARRRAYLQGIGNRRKSAAN
jgi:hypothetical protein